MLTKTRMQYKLDAFLCCIAVFVRESAGIVGVFLVLQTFNNIGGWNMQELFFLFSIIFLTYSFLVFLFSGIRDFSNIVNNGEFDKYLLRPRSVLLQIISANSDYFAAIGHGTLGLVLFIISANSIGTDWSFANILYLIITIIGGVLIQASIWLLFSCSSFFLIKTDSLKDFLYWNTRKFAGYPLSVFPGFIQKLLMFVIPFAFVNYFPAQYFLHKPDLAN
jgi:ABC-2 type transport system permease protein